MSSGPHEPILTIVIENYFKYKTIISTVQKCLNCKGLSIQNI